MRCIICGLEKNVSKEHIIPEAMGNKKFVTYKVCESCNNRLGTNVDSYLTDYIVIKLIRKELGLLGKDEKEIKVFPSSASDTNGEKFVFRNDAPLKPPKVELKGNILHIEAKTIEEGIKLAKKKLERCGYTDENIEQIVKSYKEKESKRYKPTFQIEANIDKGRYLLAGIKIAYEFACEVLDDTYFDDNIAEKLRNELYKVSKFDKNELSTCVDYFTIKKYAILLAKESMKMKSIVESLINKFNPPARHICILHDSADNELICDVILLFENMMSFTILLSEDAAKYKMKGEFKVAVVLENGDVFLG